MISKLTSNDLWMEKVVTETLLSLCVCNRSIYSFEAFISTSFPTTSRRKTTTLSKQWPGLSLQSKPDAPFNSNKNASFFILFGPAAESRFYIFLFSLVPKAAKVCFRQKWVRKQFFASGPFHCIMHSIAWEKKVRHIKVGPSVRRFLTQHTTGFGDRDVHV